MKPPFRFGTIANGVINLVLFLSNFPLVIQSFRKQFYCLRIKKEVADIAFVKGFISTGIHRQLHFNKMNKRCIFTEAYTRYIHQGLSIFR
jgi:hypothetical protein